MIKFLSMFVILFSTLILSSNFIFAAEKKEVPKDLGREMITFKMGIMELRFQHWKHQTDVHNDCFNCHKSKIGVIDGWGKDVAHKICIPCHDLENKGPIQCHECHRK